MGGAEAAAPLPTVCFPLKSTTDSKTPTRLLSKAGMRGLGEVGQALGTSVCACACVCARAHAHVLERARTQETSTKDPPSPGATLTPIAHPRLRDYGSGNEDSERCLVCKCGAGMHVEFGVRVQAMFREALVQIQYFRSTVYSFLGEHRSSWSPRRQHRAAGPLAALIPVPMVMLCTVTSGAWLLCPVTPHLWTSLRHKLVSGFSTYKHRPTPCPTNALDP